MRLACALAYIICTLSNPPFNPPSSPSESSKEESFSLIFFFKKNERSICFVAIPHYLHLILASKAQHVVSMMECFDLASSSSPASSADSRGSGFDVGWQGGRNGNGVGGVATAMAPSRSSLIRPEYGPILHLPRASSELSRSYLVNVPLHFTRISACMIYNIHLRFHVLSRNT